MKYIGKNGLRIGDNEVWHEGNFDPDDKAKKSHGHTIGDLPVAASGTSSTTQLVRADDSRLSNARAPTTHTHTKSQITDMPTKLSQFENDIGAGAGLNIVVSPTKPAGLSTGDWWYKEV